MSSNEPNRLLAMLKLSEAELLQDLGADISKTEGIDLGKLSPEELRNRAEKWLQLYKNKLLNQVCKEWKLDQKAKNPRYSDPLFLATSIADIVTSLHLKVSPFTVGALVAKIGLDRLCDGQ
jgi:hypothetical protein